MCIMKYRFSLLAFSLILCAAPAFADEAGQPDRPDPSDRPGKASGPITVEKGHFEVESDFVNYTHDHAVNSSNSTQTYVVADPLLKYGLTENTDIEVQLGGYQWDSVKDRSAGTRQSGRGFGDTTFRVKSNLMGNDGQGLALALLPYVKVPMADQSLRDAGFANNRIEGGLAVPMSYNLPYDFVVGYQAEWAGIKNADDGNYHANIINIASIGHDVPGVKDLGALAEIYSNVTTSKSPNDPNIYTGDFALTYQLTPKTVIDVETDIGLNREAPDLQLISGISYLF
jgi:hypothetical protein